MDSSTRLIIASCFSLNMSMKLFTSAIEIGPWGGRIRVRVRARVRARVRVSEIGPWGVAARARVGLQLRVLRLGGGWHGRGEWVRVRVRVRVRLDLSAALAPVERWPDALAQPLRILLELVQQLVLLAGVDGALVGLVVDVLHQIGRYREI